MANDKRKFLSLKENLALSKHVAEFYPTLERNDEQFAHHASHALGFEVTSAHVMASRIAQDIPSTVARLKAERLKAEEAQRAAGILPPPNPAGSLYARVRDLEALTAALEVKVNDLQLKLADLL